MRPDQTVSANGGSSAAVDEADSHSTSESLRAECRRQEVVIDGLRDALANLRRGARALKAENADLRGENERLRARADERELVQVAIALDVRAGGARRGGGAGRPRATLSGRGRGRAPPQRATARFRADRQQLATQRR